MVFIASNVPNNMCCCVDQILVKYYACVEITRARHLAFGQTLLLLLNVDCG